MARRLPLALAFALALLAGSAGAGSSASPTSSPTSGGATARAYAIRVLVPGGGASTAVLSSPPEDTAAYGPGFSYSGTEGPAVTTGSYTASVSATPGDSPTASASAEVTNLSLFNGEVTATDVVARARATGRAGSASGDLSGGGVSGLTVGGQPAGGGRVALGDWGYAIVDEQSSAETASPAGYHGFSTALDIHLTADHGGLPANTEIQVGYAEASVQAPTAPPRPPPPPPTPPQKKPKPPAPHAKKAPGKTLTAPEPPKPTPGIPPSPLPRRSPPSVTPSLTAGRYVFPVYGPSSYSDTFGAFRGDVSGNWHHGDDIFAPLGAPVLAVADGTVFSIGWNDVGGNRLWLRDREGNQFYYAHLSAFTPYAVNNAHVRAGTVLGFVGSTGDAEGTPYHLHFEIHPVGLLGLGYDGAVDPTKYLDAWRRLQDVRFAAAAGWAPAPVSGNSAPAPGAILLQASDISSANGLAPGSIEHAMDTVPVEGRGSEPAAPLRPPHGRVVTARGPRSSL